MWARAMAAHMEVREKFVEVSSLLLWCGSSEMKSGP